MQNIREEDVKVKCHPGAATDDIVDHLNRELRKKPDVNILQGGTNDLCNGLETMHHAVGFLLINQKISASQGLFFLTFKIYLWDTFSKILEIFHIYFFNYAQSVERCQSFQAKPLTKKHNLKL